VKDEETERAQIDLEKRLAGIDTGLSTFELLYKYALENSEQGDVLLERSLIQRTAEYLRDTVMPALQELRDRTDHSIAGLDQAITALDPCDPVKAAEYRQGYGLILPAGNGIKATADATDKKLAEAYEQLSRFLITS
jgi:hypothetical protein